MTRDEVLREIQKRIAEARGYTDVRQSDAVAERPLIGVLHADEGSTLIPRWPQDWCDAGVLLDEMQVFDYLGFSLDHYPKDDYLGRTWYAVRHAKAHDAAADGLSPAEAIARCWCAWKGIDLSDIR